MCLSKKIKKEHGKIFCLLGDGESNEGTTWESLILADNLKLNNLVCIIDNNNSQTRSVSTKQIFKKFDSFGFNVLECDGHDLEKLEKSFHFISEKPLCIICNTVKGYGIKEMEDNMHVWHHGAPNEEQHRRFIQELEEK